MLFFRTEDSSRKEKKEISFLSGKHRRHRNRKTAPGRRFRRLEFFLAGILDWDGPSGHLSSAHESYLRKTLEKNGSLLEL